MIQIQTIASMRQQRPAEFDGLAAEIRRLGTDNRWIFGADYEFEGGWRLQQRTVEITALLLLLASLRPAGAYVEIGTASGGTTRLIHRHLTFEQSLSLDDGCHPDAGLQDVNLREIPRLVRYRGDSHAPGARAFLKRELQHPVAVALVDGDHTYTGVSQDVRLVLEHMKPGALLVLHDTVAVPDVGRCWQETIDANLTEPVAHFVDDHHAACGIGVARVR